MAKTTVNGERVVALSLAVREYVKVNGRGCPSGHIVHALGFTPGELAHAVETRMVEKTKGKTGGVFPFGEIPQTEDATPSVTSRAFDMILAISRGEPVSPSDARDLWDEREALNANRRKSE
jgi:hypothetical protein